MDPCLLLLVVVNLLSLFSSEFGLGMLYVEPDETIFMVALSLDFGSGRNVLDRRIVRRSFRRAASSAASTSLRACWNT